MGRIFPILFSVFILGVVSLTQTVHAAEIRNVLVLGDSHFVGHFGEYFHRYLHETKRFDVLSIAIGGAGSKHFVLPLKNHCCGYKIRMTCRQDSIPLKQPIPVIEKASVGNNAIVGKTWNGKLTNAIRFWQPDAIIIALGSNYVNAHDELLALFQKYKPTIPIVWVGPYKRKNLDVRMQAIKKALAPLKNCVLVRSDDLIGHDTITSYHYYGKKAQVWAQTVVNRSIPFLDTVFNSSVQLTP